MKYAITLTLLLALASFADAKKSRSAAGMALIPGGVFTMGSPEGVGLKDEHPAHKVRLKPFYMDTKEVTVAQYRAFAGQDMPDQPAWSSDNHPVLGVPWKKAWAYCKAQGKRLPTEAEWEKAARGGSTKAYFFGDDPRAAARYCWFKDNASGTAHPVGLLSPNQYGLYDMCGNAFEWTSDIYSAEYYASSPVFNPTGPDNNPLIGKKKAKAAPQPKTEIRRLKRSNFLDSGSGRRRGSSYTPAQQQSTFTDEELAKKMQGMPNASNFTGPGLPAKLPGAPADAEKNGPTGVKQLDASFDGSQSIAEGLLFPSKRGGSWLAGPDMLRSAMRSGDEQAGGGLDIGFRCAK